MLTNRWLLLGLLVILWTGECHRLLSNPLPSANIGASRQDSPPPMISFETLFERHLRELTPQQRKSLILQMAKTGRYFNVPELWQIDDPLIIMHAVTQFPEPLDPVMIQALARVLPRLQSVPDSDRAAAILYRYGDKSGENLLKNHLAQDGDLTSAIILADNQDQSALQPILNLYSQNPQRSAGLVPYLASWKSSLIGTALVTGFKSDQENANYATAVAEHYQELSEKDRISALSLIRKQFNVAGADEPAKIIAATALIKLHADPENKMLNDLVSKLHSKRTSPYNKYEIILQLRYISPEYATPLLEEVVDRYVVSSPSSLRLLTNDPEQVISSDNFAVNAAESLVYLHSASSDDSISKLLEKLYVMNASPELLDRTARALLTLGGSRASITRIMGSAWLARENAVQQLRPLPSNFCLVNLFDPHTMNYIFN